MCRFLGVVAAQQAPLAELLAAELEPFIELAREHEDGWGISYLDSRGRVATAKEPVSALESMIFGPLMERVISNAAILHLRLGSPGLVATPANTHPFGSVHCGFAHNGHFTPASALDETLGESLAMVKGGTDSERFYLAVRRRIDAGIAPAAAIAAAGADIRALASWNSTNCLLLMPGALYASADHNPRSEVIGRRGRDYFDIRCLTEPGRVVVASTGWPQQAGRWERLPDRRVLEIGLDLTATLHHSRRRTGWRAANGSQWPSRQA
jgi:predicted glutamine amidotransferase